MNQDAAHCQRIEIMPLNDGWVVTEGGRTAGQFDNVESAYKSALAICGDLFEQGVRSQVTERAAAA
ncbi:hypothetical protein [Caulobacter sp.]|jgi:hypothetical protein|uniref:hypothetical protein n=1 Tax=Caulobacter sp. TaxID=78 RepID=UPI00160ED116